MRATCLAVALLAVALLAAAVPNVRAGSLVDVAVEVAGVPVPLYDAVDGSGRLYFEAREGCAYALRLSNRSHERLGTLVVVDGLNAISGEREEIGRGRPGRLYVLAPWAQVEVRGWRTSLDQVRQFTFVDERSSYAARVGKANARMGWVEVAVYRDRTPAGVGGWRRERPLSGAEEDEGRDAPAAGPLRMEQVQLLGVGFIAVLGLLRRARATPSLAPEPGLEPPAEPSVDVEVRTA